jgi:hypothetical protein
MKISIALLLLLFAVRPAHAGVSCDAVDDYITTSLAASTFITAAAGTMSIWVKVSGTAPSVSSAYLGDLIMAEDQDRNFGIFRVKIGADDRIWVYNWDTNEDRIGITYSVDTWTHIAWVHTGGTLYAYKNGIEVANIPSGNTISMAYDFLFCGMDNETIVIEGNVDEAATWSVGLSATEIAQLASGRIRGLPLQIQPSNLTGYWPFDDCPDGTSADGLTAIDRSGNGRNATYNDGTNNTGTTCKAGEVLSYP